MKRTLYYLSILFAVLCHTACGRHETASHFTTGGDTITMRHAENITLVDFDGYTVATLRNPWDSLKILHTYVLVDKQLNGRFKAEDFPQSTVINIPIKKALIFSSVHCGLFDELGVSDNIAGVCDLQYIKLPKILKACQNGRVADCGNGMSPDIERIIELHPDAMLISPFENSGGYGRVEKLNIPIIECADYMETSPLGRAEWMRFYGRLTGCPEKADSLFNKIEKEYLGLSRKARSQPQYPTVLAELKNSGAWYVPGGKSTTGRLFADAGANYIFSNLSQSGSVPLAFETVFNAANKADYWFIKYNQRTDKTYSELERDYAPYAHFEAFKQRRIYGCNTGHRPFYEETPYHPERLLQDIITIIHPQISNNSHTRYFSKLKE